jgi:hypothetical protein
MARENGKAKKVKKAKTKQSKYNALIERGYANVVKETPELFDAALLLIKAGWNVKKKFGYVDNGEFNMVLTDGCDIIVLSIDEMGDDDMEFEDEDEVDT